MSMGVHSLQQCYAGFKVSITEFIQSKLGQLWEEFDSFWEVFKRQRIQQLDLTKVEAALAQVKAYLKITSDRKHPLHDKIW